MAPTLPDTNNRTSQLFLAAALLITTLDGLQIVLIGKGLPAVVGALYYLAVAWFYRHPQACVAAIVLPILPACVLLFGLPATTDVGMKTVFCVQLVLAFLAALRLKQPRQP